jgi:hypothetical protein
MTVECIVQEISKQYGMNKWHDDVKQLLQHVSSPEQHLVILFTDSQVITYLLCGTTALTGTSRH